MRPPSVYVRWFDIGFRKAFYRVYRRSPVSSLDTFTAANYSGLDGLADSA
ncbi:MAG: hypothetical protein NTU88_10905 [Armatimonadetes bacterium]|nr:hypothetical protein [Armatimonadota bacterium]